LTIYVSKVYYKSCQLELEGGIMKTKLFSFEDEISLRKDIGVRLKEFRDMRGYDQTTLAENLGTAQNTISRIESGRLPLRILHLVSLANLGCDLQWLITGEKKKTAYNKEEIINAVSRALS
jgi:DNA-binding XRE family transcriptional regulator